MLVVVGCGANEPAAGDTAGNTSGNTAEPAPPEPGPADGLAHQDGFFMPPGAPAEPTGCETATECAGDNIPDLAEPCCDHARSYRIYRQSYRSAVQAWRSEHCGGVTCPPLPPPAPPPPCAFEMRCVEGTCQDSCPR